MEIEGFLFDLGNVLVHFSNERMCRQIGELAGVDGPTVASKLKASGLLSKFEKGEIDEAGFHQRFEELVDCRVDRAALFRAGSDIFSVNESMVDVVRRLRRKGKRLVLLSNTCAPHIDWIRERYGVLELFDELVLSFEAKAVKPEEAIFRIALERLALPAQRCLYTDDISRFVEAGRGFGLQGIVFENVAQWKSAVKSLGVDVGG